MIENNKNEYSDCDGVAIIGVGFRIPKNESGSTDELWNNLINKFDGTSDTSDRWNSNYYQFLNVSNSMGLVSLDEWKNFDPLFFGINPSESETIDPQQRLLLKCTWEALEDALIDPLSIRGTKTSVYTGASRLEYLAINKNSDKVVPNIFNSKLHSISNRISYCFDFRGPSITLDTACASSLNSIEMGYRSILNGISEISIAGGVNLNLDVNEMTSFADMGIVSKKGGKCRSFDADADGFVSGEGVGMVVLKSLKQAIKDGNNIYCVITGASSNVDGGGVADKSNFFAPSKLSQSENIKTALSSTNGKVSIYDIDFVEAHGTGTPVGDPVETEGIYMALNHSGRSNENPLLIGSFKSNIGHLETASGVASVIKCCLMFRNKCFAPNVNFKTPNPAIKFNEWNLKVVTDPIPFSTLGKSKPISMVVNNFGVTGANGCLILSEYKNDDGGNSSTNNNTDIPSGSNIGIKKFLIPFSANSSNSLNQLIEVSKGYNTNGSDNVEFIDILQQQIQSKSLKFIQRSVITASNWDEFIDESNSIKTLNQKLTSNMSLSSSKKNPITVFVFCGQSSQYPSMCSKLYETEDVFRKSMDLLDMKLSKYYGYSVLDKLRSINDNDMESIHNPFNVQAAICMIQISLFELYKHWGIDPSFIIGHSLGEVTATYCSGMIDLDTFCYLIYHRSIIQSKTNGNGKMLSVSISADEFQSKFSSRYPSIEIACYNSPTSTVIAGDKQLLNEISNELKDQGIFTSMLGSLAAYHTSKQLCIKDDVLSLDIKSKSATIPIFSTSNAELFKGTSPFNAESLFENILKPVQFTQTISNLYKHIESNKLGSEIVFIEIAPHPTLSFYLNQMIPKESEYFNNDSISVYSPIHKKKNDTEEFNKMISKLYCQGYNGLNFKSQLDSIDSSVNKNKQIKSPLYQWDDQEYWKIDSLTEKTIKNGMATDHLGLSMSYYSPLFKSFQTRINTQKEPFSWLKGHMVQGKVYFPGCGYLCNILQLFNDKKQDLYMDIVEFKLPFLLSEGDNSGNILQTNVYITGKNEYKALFHIKDQKSNVWSQSSYANFQVSNTNTTGEKYDIESIISKECNLTVLSQSDLYDHIKNKAGINYLGDFKRVSKCYLGEHSSLSEVTLNLPLQEYSGQELLSTAILDSCIHGVFALIDDHCQIVGDRIEGLTYYSTNSQVERNKHSKLYSYSRIKYRINNSYHSHITIIMEDGTILIDIENCVVTSITPVKEIFQLNIQQMKFIQVIYNLLIPKFVHLVHLAMIFNKLNLLMNLIICYHHINCLYQVYSIQI